MTNVGYCACNKYNPHFITTHSINNPNYIKMQQNKNQQLDAKFRKFIKVLIMNFITIRETKLYVMMELVRMGSDSGKQDG